MDLESGTNYFVAQTDVVMRQSATGRKAANHLILGDWLRYLGQQSGDMIKIRYRGDTGWIPKDAITRERALGSGPINFAPPVR